MKTLFLFVILSVSFSGYAKDSHQHSSSQAPAAKVVAPETALGWLKNGNSRYLHHKLRKDGQDQSDVAKLASGQTPHSMVLSCSDSRVPPELVLIKSWERSLWLGLPEKLSTMRLLPL